jgi:hypothetical protein
VDWPVVVKSLGHADDGVPLSQRHIEGTADNRDLSAGSDDTVNGAVLYIDDSTACSDSGAGYRPLVTSVIGLIRRTDYGADSRSAADWVATMASLGVDVACGAGEVDVVGPGGVNTGLGPATMAAVVTGVAVGGASPSVRCAVGGAAAAVTGQAMSVGADAVGRSARTELVVADACGRAA